MLRSATPAVTPGYSRLGVTGWAMVRAAKGERVASVGGSFTVRGKASNGEGSLYRESDGTWRATYHVPGEPRPRRARGRTREEALRRRDEALAEALETVALTAEEGRALVAAASSDRLGAAVAPTKAGTAQGSPPCRTGVAAPQLRRPASRARVHDHRRWAAAAPNRRQGGAVSCACRRHRPQRPGYPRREIDRRHGPLHRRRPRPRRCRSPRRPRRPRDHGRLRPSPRRPCAFTTQAASRLLDRFTTNGRSSRGWSSCRRSRISRGLRPEVTRRRSGTLPPHCAGVCGSSGARCRAPPTRLIAGCWSC